MTLITSEFIAQCIRNESPAPSEWFGRAVWLSGVAAALKKVLAEVEAESKIAAEVILDDGLTDNTYEIVPLTKQERMIDADALRRNNPGLYEQCAFVDADLMVRTLGRSVLRRMMIEKLGSDAVLPLESVTIASVKDVLGDEEFPEYIKTVTVPNGYVIRKKAVN